jgi:hypothetical protein
MASLKFLAAWAYISTKPLHSGQGVFRFLPAGKGMGMGAIADNDIKTSLLLGGTLAVRVSRSDARVDVRHILFDRERRVL